MRMRPATLGGRLTLDVFLLVAGLVVAGLLAVDRLLGRELARGLARDADAQLRYVEGLMQHHERGEDRFVREELQDIEARGDALVDIRDGDTPIFVSPALHGGRLPEQPGTVSIGGVSYQATASRLGGLSLKVAVAATAVERLNRSIDLTLGALLATGLILAGAVARVLARRIVAPLEAVATAAERVQAESLSTRLEAPASGYEEVRRLVTSFNEMLQRLEAAVGRLGRFTADAAHELRTPLAGMKAQVQSALSCGVPDSNVRATLDRVSSEIDRLAHLVERLLLLSRVDTAAIDLQRVDWSDLVVERVERARELAIAQSVQLVLVAPDPVEVMGDAVLLRQLADNLLENALKYSPPGGLVRIRLHRTGPSCVLSVADSGIGIGPDALPQVFDRFYREDSSRSRGTGGAGLGLAIVYAVVKAHAGRVQVASAPGEGTTVRVELPAVPAAAIAPAVQGSGALAASRGKR